MSKPLLNKLDKLLETGILLEYVDSVYAYNQVLILLGYSKNKDSYVKILKHYFKNNEIDTSHFTSNGLPPAKTVLKICPVCTKEFKVRGAKAIISQNTCSYICATKKYRTGEAHPNYTLGHTSYRDSALKVQKTCSLCGYDNTLALEVHHRDKNRLNNDLSNLEVLCANCHSIKHKTGV